MTEKELMLAGRLYNPLCDPQLREDHLRARRLTRKLNGLSEEELDTAPTIIRELFGTVGSNPHVEPAFHCDYGFNIHVGNNFFANYNCVMLDVCEIRIGDNVMLAPQVGLYTATRPIDAGVRNAGLEYGAPITIGSNVWIGGGTTVNPGVTIGSNTVIGSGSVVVKDIPGNVIAVGNPCKVLREITEEDRSYWEEKRKQYEASRSTDAG